MNDDHPNHPDSTTSKNFPLLPARPSDGHKGTFGTVFVIGGNDADSSSMIGAPALTAIAALRAGCGLAQLAVPRSILQSALIIAPSATGIALPKGENHRLDASGCAEVIDRFKSRASTLAVGPGFGVGFEQQQIIMRLLSDDEWPIVLDADGINNLSQVRDFTADLHAPLIITPHPGEFSRLAEALAIKVNGRGTVEERTYAARAMAQRLGCLVVLKGAGTVVTDGQRAWVCEIKEPALATAGSGDVLTGIIASLTAQFWKPHLGMGKVTPDIQGGLDLFQCAAWGVEIHARCGQSWASRHQDSHAGMLATELADEIPHVLARIRAG